VKAMQSHISKIIVIF